MSSRLQPLNPTVSTISVSPSHFAIDSPNHVGLGSDFDGAVVPEKIGSAAGLPVLVETLRQRGYSEPLLKKLGSTNWLDLLERTIG